MLPMCYCMSIIINNISKPFIPRAVVIIATDGASNNRPQTIQEAEALRNVRSSYLPALDKILERKIENTHTYSLSLSLSLSLSVSLSLSIYLSIYLSQYFSVYLFFSFFRSISQLAISESVPV